MWFYLSILGYFCLGLVFLLDKIVLERSFAPPVVYTFYSTIFLFASVLLFPFGGELLVGIDWFWALIAGTSFGFALWALFIGLDNGETSHMSPFVGAFVVVFTYILSQVFLGEALSDMQLIGISVLTFSSFLLSFEKSEKNNGFHKGFLWGLIAAFLFAISHVASKFLYTEYPFLTGFIWSRAFIAIVGIICLFSPAVWKSFAPKSKKKSKKHQKELGFILANKLLGVIGVILIQYAIFLGSVTLVNALAGIQFVFLFLLVIFFTRFYPKVFKEKFTKNEIIIEVLALLGIVIGAVFLVL